MRAAVALLCSSSLMFGACFPKDAHKRTYAQLGEGASIIAGIAMLSIVNSGADCDMMSAPGGQPDDNCKNKASVLGDLGLGFILLGLLGFVATVSTAEDDDKKPEIIVKPADDKKPATTAPTPPPTPAPTPAAAPTPPPAAPEPVPAGAGAG